MQSNWEEKEHKKFMESVEKDSPKLEDIIHKINDIERLLLAVSARDNIDLFGLGYRPSSVLLPE